MNDHDAISVVIEADETTVTCACGRTFVANWRGDAVEAHRGHHGVERAREALKAGVRDSLFGGGDEAA